MKHFSRLGWTVLVVSCAGLTAASERGVSQPITLISEGPVAFFAHHSQGYLGIDIHDIDSDRALALKLKDAHGAEIVTVDHDAPANKAGLKVHDVVLEMNGQQVDNAEQLRRLLKETPAGRSISFLISRDGQQQTISAEMGDRAQVEAKAWKQHFTVPDPSDGTT